MSPYQYCRYFFIYTLVFVSMVRDASGGPYEDKLIKKIFVENYYSIQSRPVPVESEAIEVKFGLSLQQIIDLDEKNEMLKTNMWLKYEWKDYKLVWNESEYDGVTSIRLPSSMIWTPDILMYNSASEQIDSKFATNVVVSSDGSCSWVPLGLYVSACAIDIKWFPFDDQTCKMKFGSWTYDGSKINLTSLGNEIDMTTYQENGEWMIMEVPVVRSVQLYECCPDPYIDVTFIIHIRRRTLYYGFNLIIPCALIAFLALLTFTLPPDEGEKIGLGITILLALSVYQMIVAEMVPATSMATPLVGTYFTIVMIMCTISVIMTVAVLNFHHRSPDMYEMPNWIRIGICGWLAWILRISRPGKTLTREALLQKMRIRDLESKNPPSTSLISNIKDIDNLIQINEQCRPSLFNNNTNCNPLRSYENGKTSTSAPSASPISTFTDEIPLGVTLLRNELLSILNELRFMTNKIKEDGESEEETNDWKFVAMVIDRLCLWFFAAYLIIGTLVIFFSAPNLQSAL